MMAGPAVARVEFLGLPGSGKSTVSHAVADVLRRRGLVVDEPTWSVDHELSSRRRYFHKICCVGRELVSRPGGAARTLAIVARSRQRRPAETLRAWRNWLFVSASTRRTTSPVAMQLLDQGLFQALWSVCFQARAAHLAELLGPLVDAVRCPDLVVELEVSSAELERRLSMRRDGMSRLDGPGRPPESWERAERAMAEVHTLLEMAADSGRTRVLRIGNDDPGGVSAATRRVAALLRPAAWNLTAEAPERRAATADAGSPMRYSGPSVR